MKEYLSQKDLEKIYRQEKRSIGLEGIQDKVFKKRNIEADDLVLHKIFLSHSHLDKTIVSKIILLFDRLNTEIYVDWLDKTLPEQTNAKTANSIKIKIQNSNKFLFLATYYGLRSRWCNWELGIADALTKAGNLAILPIESRAGNWEGNEYLRLYPEMKLETDDLERIDEHNVFIHKTSGDKVSLMDWLKN